jgi:hypothetical protein
MENHHAINGKINYFDWAIFNSYVKLPEGISNFISLSESYIYTDIYRYSFLHIPILLDIPSGKLTVGP